ncbi:hypothetical protein ACP70R_031292 [Stipagrostis hirtigluma subsp. patula]
MMRVFSTGREILPESISSLRQIDRLCFDLFRVEHDQRLSVGVGRKNADADNAAAGVPSVEEAMGYVQMVKEAFKDAHPEKYHLFLRVMDDFRNQRIGVAEVTSTAAALFRDTPELILGFNVFLPKGHKIHLVGLDELAACFVRNMNLHDDDDDGDNSNDDDDVGGGGN